jgi:hypothetical protein
LAPLGAQCGEADAGLGPALAQVDELTPNAWSYRYPTELVEPPEADVLEAKALAFQPKSSLSLADLLTNLLTLATKTNEKQGRKRAIRMSQVVEEKKAGRTSSKVKSNS